MKIVILFIFFFLLLFLISFFYQIHKEPFSNFIKILKQMSLFFLKGKKKVTFGNEIFLQKVHHQVAIMINFQQSLEAHQHLLILVQFHYLMVLFQHEFFVLFHRCLNHYLNPNRIHHLHKMNKGKKDYLIDSFSKKKKITFLYSLRFPESIFRLDAITIFINFWLWCSICLIYTCFGCSCIV